MVTLNYVLCTPEPSHHIALLKSYPTFWNTYVVPSPQPLQMSQSHTSLPVDDLDCLIENIEQSDT